VVSGGARGIDSAAHQGTLSGKGRAIAVLGTGINLVALPEKAELFERITANGAVITQFPFNGPADFTTVELEEDSSIDEVIRACGLPSSAVNVALFSLEMKRLVKQLRGKLYVRNK
jgi:DNA processing protein